MASRVLITTAFLAATGCLGSSTPDDSGVTTYSVTDHAQAPDNVAQGSNVVAARPPMRFRTATDPNSCLLMTSNVAGTMLQARPCTHVSGMHWAFRGGQLMNDNGLCLGGANPADANASVDPVAQTCDPYADNQQWTFQRDTLRLTNTTRCLTWPDGVNGNAATLTLTTCDDANAPVSQQWPVSSEGFDLRDPLNPNNCLQAVTADAGAQVVMAACGAQHEAWQLQKDALTLHGLCLDTAVAAPVAGTVIVLADCDGGATQQWFVRLGHVRLETLFLCLAQTTTTFGQGRTVAMQACDVNVPAQELWMQ